MKFRPRGAFHDSKPTVRQEIYEIQDMRYLLLNLCSVLFSMIQESHLGLSLTINQRLWGASTQDDL